MCREQNEQPLITKRDIATVLLYVQTWPARYVSKINRNIKMGGHLESIHIVYAILK